MQFVRDESGETIVMFELAESDGEIRVVDEKHSAFPSGDCCSNGI